jgi:hypothetical protein
MKKDISFAKLDKREKNLKDVDFICNTDSSILKQLPSKVET